MKNSIVKNAAQWMGTMAVASVGLAGCGGPAEADLGEQGSLRQAIVRADIFKDKDCPSGTTWASGSIPGPDPLPALAQTVAGPDGNGGRCYAVVRSGTYVNYTTKTYGGITWWNKLPPAQMLPGNKYTVSYRARCTDAPCRVFVDHVGDSGPASSLSHYRRLDTTWRSYSFTAVLDQPNRHSLVVWHLDKARRFEIDDMTVQLVFPDTQEGHFPPVIQPLEGTELIGQGDLPTPIFYHSGVFNGYDGVDSPDEAYFHNVTGASDAPAGSSYVRVHTGGVSNGWNYGGVSFWRQIPTNDLKVARYSLSYWARSLSGPFRLVVSVQNGNGDVNDLRHNVTAFGASSEWVKYTYTADLPADQRRHTIYFTTQNPDADKTFDLDQLELKEVPASTPLGLTSTPSP